MLISAEDMRNRAKSRRGRHEEEAIYPPPISQLFRGTHGALSLSASDPGNLSLFELVL